MEISLIWWNTGLSPSSKQNRSSDDNKDIVIDLINLLLREADMLSLGEVSSDDISLIRKHCYLNEFSLHDGVVQIGKGFFDTCVIYRTDKLQLWDYKNIHTTIGTRNIRVAQRLDFAISGGDKPLHIFLSHWPSRMYCGENSSERHSLGMNLRSAVEEASQHKDLSNIIILGDFNDEPFDKSLSEQLMATRDRNWASKKRHLLYNPFWRCVGAKDEYSRGEKVSAVSGSYYYKSDAVSRWRTFDQIIFSSAFLGHSEWHLKESMVQILDISPYTSLVLNHKKIFDHLPVKAVIEKEG